MFCNFTWVSIHPLNDQPDFVLHFCSHTFCLQKCSLSTVIQSVLWQTLSGNMNNVKLSKTHSADTHTPSVSADVKSGLCGSSSRNVSNLKKTFQYFKGNINKKKEQMSFLLNVIWLTVAEVENDTMRYKHWYIMRGWCFPTPAVIFSRFFCPLCCSGAPQRRSVALLKTFFFFSN